MDLLIVVEPSERAGDLLPALELLGHTSTVCSPSGATAGQLGGADVIIVDATGSLGAASQACRRFAVEGSAPLLVVIGEPALAALKASWGFDDWLLVGAQPAEVETRLRLLLERSPVQGGAGPTTSGDLQIDEDTYVVRLHGRVLDLTYREFELLRYLVRSPGRVFTRGQLLQEVWGYDYYGGTRTVDVHVRRLRAKFGAGHEELITTVRGVGYKLSPDGAGVPTGP